MYLVTYWNPDLCEVCFYVAEDVHDALRYADGIVEDMTDINISPMEGRK